jgi:hypothetical protein
MSNVIDLNKVRQQQQNRTPLYISHLKGTVSGSPQPTRNDFGDRLHRIREALERINRLMVELKKMSEVEKQEDRRR